MSIRGTVRRQAPRLLIKTSNRIVRTGKDKCPNGKIKFLLSDQLFESTICWCGVFIGYSSICVEYFLCRMFLLLSYHLPAKYFMVLFVSLPFSTQHCNLSCYSEATCWLIQMITVYASNASTPNKNSCCQWCNWYGLCNSLIHSGKAHVYKISNMAAPIHIQHSRANVCENVTETIMRRFIFERTIAKL